MRHGVFCVVYFLSVYCIFFFFFKQKTAYEMRISDWSSDVCSSDLTEQHVAPSRCEGSSSRQGEFPLHGPSDGISDGDEASCIADQRALLQRLAAVRGKIGRASCRERVCQYV